MKIKSTFEKGLSSDFSSLKQPKGTYPNAENIVRDIMGTVKSEPGTIEKVNFSSISLSNTTTLGEVSIDDILVYFVKHNNGSSIVQIDSNNTLTSILETGSAGTITTDLLNFTVPIQAVARRDYKGNIILYWVDKTQIPRRLDTSETITAINFEEKLKLFTNPNLPRVTNLEVLESGGITTGLYKFAARLVTQTGNTTTFSQISQGIPVVNDSKGAGMHQYDGAPPQTPGGKSIKISLENLDTTYDFVEIAAITYLGEENLLSAFVVGKIPITTSTLEFEYYSDGQQLEEVLLEELVAEAIEYTIAESVVQKDNHLFLANLNAADLSFVEDAMVLLANQIEVHFRTKLGLQTNISYITSTSGAGGGVWNDTSPSGGTDGDVFSKTNLTIDPIVDTNFQNFKEPDWTYNFKGYQRDEVYSFAIVPIFPGGIHGTAFHIPGDSTPGRISTKENNAAETGTRLRSWQNNDGTLHHRMPSHDRLPLDGGLGTLIQNIGLDFKNVDLAAVGLDTILEGYTIVRQRRNKPGNGIVVTTGIAKELCDDKGGGLTPIPFLGKCAVIYNNEASDTSDTWGDKSKDSSVDFDIDRTGHFMFYSPDVVHGLIDNSYYSNMQEIKQVDIRSVKGFADNRGNRINNSADFIFGASYRDFSSLRDEGSADTSTLGISQVIDSSATTHVDSFISTSQRSTTLGNGINVKSAGMTDVLIMKIHNDALNKEKDNYTGETPVGGFPRDIQLGNISGNVDTHYEVAQFSESVDIYVIYSYINNVYGNLDSAEYIMTKEVYLNDSPGTEVEVWGGDTFISSYMFTLGEKGISASSPRDFRANVQVTVETRGNYDYRHFEAITFEGEIEIEGTMPYAPKYPLLYDWDPTEVSQLGLWNHDTSKGPGSSYNKHYNFENTLNKYYPKDLSFDAVTDFPNRIIYSLESFENEQFDAYRTFLTNNFHDTPKETGEITNIFEYSNILYAHTPHSLWRTFVNEKTFTNTTSGEIVLGNGGLFPIPSEQVYTQTGGFAGSTAKFSSINTPYGRVFVDDHQYKVFMLIGNSQLKELSDPLMFDYFVSIINPANAEDYQTGYDPLTKRIILGLNKAGDDNYDISHTSQWAPPWPPGTDDTLIFIDSKYGDVSQYFPMNQIFLTLDGVKSKFIMTQDGAWTGENTLLYVTRAWSGSSQTGTAHANIPNPAKNTPPDTISYSFELQSWSSLHTYGVEKFSQRDNLLFGVVGGKVYEIGKGDPNNLFGTVQTSKLSLMINDDTESKEFRNLKWIQRYKTNLFNNIIVSTENYTTGLIIPSLVTSFADEQNFLPLGQQQVNLVGGEHRMNIPPDNNPGVIYANENFRPTIKGKYGRIDLEFTPTTNPLEVFELEEFETEYINVAE